MTIKTSICHPTILTFVGEDLYLQAAKDLGLNLSEFERDRKSQEAITAIQKDMKL